MSTRIRQTDKSPADLMAAEVLDTSLAAMRSGVELHLVRAAFGDEAAHLAQSAARIVEGGLTPLAGPTPEFVDGLQLRVEAAFDARPVDARPVDARRVDARPAAARWRLPALPFSTTAELVVLGTLAAILAVGAFLLGAGSLWPGDQAAIPTANAKTLTATAATPEASATAPADASGATSIERRPAGGSGAASIDHRPAERGDPATSPPGPQRDQRVSDGAGSDSLEPVPAPHVGPGPQEERSLSRPTSAPVAHSRRSHRA